MRQFDVYPNPSAATRSFAPYVVVLQSHHLSLETVVVAPLINDAETALPIDPQVEFRGGLLTLAITELGSVDRNLLRRRAGDVLEHEDTIRRALDRLFTGF